MLVPEDIGFDGVEAHGSRFLKAVAPIGTWNPRIMHGAGDDLERLTVEFEVISIGLECMDSWRLGVKGWNCRDRAEGQREHGEQEGSYLHCDKPCFQKFLIDKCYRFHRG